MKMPIASKLPSMEIPKISFHELVFQKIRQHGSNIALINYGTAEKFSFNDILEKSEFIAKTLIALGVEKGEIVIVCMKCCPDAIYILLGISLAGAVISMLPPQFRSDGMRSQLLESETRFVFADPCALIQLETVFRSANRLHRIICTGSRDLACGYPILQDLKHVDTSNARFPSINPLEDVVFLPFSSGIHGKRKGIVTTHYVFNAKFVVSYNPSHYIHPAKGEYTVTMLPFNKQMSFECIMNALMNGATVVTLAQHESGLLNCLKLYMVRTIHTYPSLMARMILEARQHAVHLPFLSTVVTGSAPVSEHLYRNFIKTFPSVKYIIETYGMTEVGMITRSVLSEKYSSSCGQLGANLRLKVVDIATGLELGPFKRGQIFIQGESTTSPYLKDQQATREHFVDGWRKTGDIGYYDDDENVYIVDKTKEMIKVHGFQVIPSELETILLTHPCVEEAAVVAITDYKSGERPVGFVVLKKGQTAMSKSIMEYVNERVVRYKRLVQVNIAQTLPRSPCGTLLRKLLAEAAILSVNNMP